MEHPKRINHPDKGELLNRSESAKYLGISGKKFRRIPLQPNYFGANGYPYWCRRILDIIPVDKDEIPHAEILKRGIACGDYLIETMDDHQLVTFRSALTQNSTGNLMRDHACSVDEELTYILREYGIELAFSTCHEADVYREGILSAIKKRIGSID